MALIIMMMADDDDDDDDENLWCGHSEQRLGEPREDDHTRSAAHFGIEFFS
jgi:hypothetical protein